MHEVGKVPVKCVTITSLFMWDFMKKQDRKWYFARRNYKYMFLDSDSFAGQMFHAQAVASLQLSFEDARR